MRAATGQKPGKRPLTERADRGFLQRVAPVDVRKSQLPANKAGMGKKQRPQRAASESGKPAGQYAMRPCWQDGVGKNNRDVIAEEYDFPHPAAGTGSQSERIALIGVGAVQMLPKQVDAKAAETLQPRRQRTGFAQPAAQGPVTIAPRQIPAPA